ncbi:MAG: DUF7689 domain-containing protein [Phycisphaerae bacterium]
MATSNQKFPIHEPQFFFKAFPHLKEDNHRVTSKATPPQSYPPTTEYKYNCFSFVIDDRKRIWWPGGIGCGYWPRQPSSETIAEIMEVLQNDFGYKPCDNGDFEKNTSKIAIFAKGDVPVHVAIQPSSGSGKWMSKMGYNVDMEHELRAIETQDGDDHETQGYGTVVRFMKLVKR